MLAALQRSKDIYSEIRDKVYEALKADIVLGVLLEKVAQHRACTEASNNNNNNNSTTTTTTTTSTSSSTGIGTGTTAAPTTTTATNNGTSQAPSFDLQDEKQNAAMTLGLLSSGLSPGGPASPPQYPDYTARMDGGGFQQHSGGSSSHQGLMPDQNAVQSPPSGFGGGGVFNPFPDVQSFNLDWVCLVFYFYFYFYFPFSFRYYECLFMLALSTNLGKQDAWDNYIQTATSDALNPTWPMFDLQAPPPPPQQQQQQQQPQVSQMQPNTINLAAVSSAPENFLTQHPQQQPQQQSIYGTGGPPMFMNSSNRRSGVGK